MNRIKEEWTGPLFWMIYVFLQRLLRQSTYFRTPNYIPDSAHIRPGPTRHAE